MTPPNNTIATNPLLLHQALIRSAPHTFAEWASNGEWTAARHLKFISKKIAMGIAKGGLRLIVNCPPRHGKQLAHDTPLYLCKKDKYRGHEKFQNHRLGTHGELEPGDRVWNLKGWTEVLAVSEETNATLELEFKDLKVKAHENHEWWVSEGDGFRIGKLMETKDIYDLLNKGHTLWVGNGKHSLFVDKVIGCKPCNPTPGRCIQVAARDGIYHIGKNPIPTHNSWLVSKWLPVWYLDNNPSKKIIMVSYNNDMAQNWGRMVRDEFTTNPRLMTKLREDVKAVGKWFTLDKGVMLSAGMGGELVGHGFDLGLLDDPLKSYEEANSAVVRKAHKEWFEYVFYTRREPRSNIVIVMHRWHAEDLTGYLLKEHADPWECIRLPALAEANDPLGRQPGEALWPERIPASEFTGVSKRVMESMYQQKPPSEQQGRAYDHYTDAENIDDRIQLRPDLPLDINFDFNVNPGMHANICQALTKEDLIHGLFTIHDDRMKTEACIDEFIKWWRQTGCPCPQVRVYGDRSGKSETTSTSRTDYDVIINHLTTAGINHKVFVPNKNPPIKDRVDTVNEALKDAEGVVHVKLRKQCKELIRDFETQMTDADGQPDKTNQLLGHAADAFGYYMYFVRPMRRITFKPARAVY